MVVLELWGWGWLLAVVADDGGRERGERAGGRKEEGGEEEEEGEGIVTRGFGLCQKGRSGGTHRQEGRLTIFTWLARPISHVLVNPRLFFSHSTSWHHTQLTTSPPS
jgi:hypothetical protein